MQLTAALALGLNSHTVGCIRVWVQEHSCLRTFSTGTYETELASQDLLVIRLPSHAMLLTKALTMIGTELALYCKHY